MRTITEVTAALRAAAADPHRLLTGLAQTGSPALFDALLASTSLRPLGRDSLQEPVSHRFRGAGSAHLLRGLIALAPPESATASRLRAQWTGIRLSGSEAGPDTVSARYLDRLPALRFVHIDHAVGVTALPDLAAHPGLALLSFTRCSLPGSDLSGLDGACISALRWIGQHPSVREAFTLSGLSGASIAALSIEHVWKLTAVTDWPAGLTTLSLRSTPALLLPPLPDGLTHLVMAASSAPELGALPATLIELTLQAVALPDLSGMAALPRLKSLTITRGTAADLRWLPPSLTALSLTEPIRLSSLAGIEAAAGLTHLDLSRSPELTDLTPITALPRLVSLNLQGCTGLADLAPLRELPTLQHILTDATPQPAARAVPSPRAARVVPPAQARAVRTIRALLRSNSPDATRQAVELVRALASPELVEIVLAGVVLTADGGWQQLVGGRRFSGHRQPAVLSLIASAGVGKSAALRASITALRLVTPVVDCTDLSALPRLRRLKLSRVKTLQSPERLQELDRLQTIVLSRCALPESATIPAGVQTFEADRLPRWRDLTALSACRRLESVTIDDAPALVSTRGLVSRVLDTIALGRAEVLERIVGLESAPELTRLQVTGALRLTDISALSDHPALSALSLHHAIQLAAVPALPVLTTLALDGAPITTLPELPALSTLSLQRCSELSTLSSLGSGLTSIHLLQCHLLTSIGPLADCRSLLGVHLVGCPRVGDLSPLAGLSSLRRLTIRDCSAALDLTPLAGCRALTEVDLRGCSDLSGLSVLGLIHGLKSVRLSGAERARADLPLSLQRIVRWGQ